VVLRRAAVRAAYNGRIGNNRLAISGVGMLNQGEALLSGIRQAAFISPHPDDVELCCGILIRRFLRKGTLVRYVCVTDGAPKADILDTTPRPPRQNYDRDAYKSVRRAETSSALGILGVPHSEITFLDYPDLETASHVSDLVAEFGNILPTVDAVFCCPFEGGHPDHDICRFALAIASATTKYSGAVFEYASYNHLGYQIFSDPIPPSFTLVATAEERCLQQRLAGVFISQEDEPQQFRVDRQLFRAANSVFSPESFEAYRGTPYYERFAYPGTTVLASINAYLERFRDGRC
jgi:LmbE family N-acetylglucosaminyl deacetylase